MLVGMLRTSVQTSEKNMQRSIAAATFANLMQQSATGCRIIMRALLTMDEFVALQRAGRQLRSLILHDRFIQALQLPQVIDQFKEMGAST